MCAIGGVGRLGYWRVAVEAGIVSVVRIVYVRNRWGWAIGVLEGRGRGGYS
jgi:hypothetical protein